MNSLLITRVPTLCNTENMKLPELREQYKRLEGDAIDQAQQLSDVCAKLHEMNLLALNLQAHLYALCESWDAGDQAAILLQVKQLAERRIKTKAKVH